MSNLIVIGLVGKKRSGKDTIAKYLEKYGFIRIAFADTLKEVCKLVFHFTDEQVYGDDLKEVVDEFWHHTPRDILQKVGTDLFRERLPELCSNISNNIWIRSAERKMKDLISKGYNKFVFTDVRFPNELEFVKKLDNSVSWKVIRPNLKNQDNHSSEKNIDELSCDIVINNNSSLQDLDKIVTSEINKLILSFSS